MERDSTRAELARKLLLEGMGENQSGDYSLTPKGNFDAPTIPPFG